MLLLLGGSLLLLAGLWLFLARRHFALRALAFVLLALAGFIILALIVSKEHAPGLVLLAGLGLPVSVGLAVLGAFLARRLERLTAENDPDAGEGRHD